jgi:hypothetical protein
MIATIVNCITVLIGSFIGLFFHARIRDSFKEVVFLSAGFISLLIGLGMALETGSFMGMLFAIAFGGMIGYRLDIEGGVLRLGGYFERISLRFKKKPVTPSEEVEEEKNFALGFLNASVLFCVGAMTIVGAIQAGAESNYELILIKSMMDGFMAIMFTAAYGIGVAFSVITILVYQGGLTLLAEQLAPIIGDTGLAELSAIGGVLVMMIGFNLLKLREIKTANFVPALLLIPLISWLTPRVSGWFYSLF